MKKLLLILLCLPIIGFGQAVSDFQDYVPGFLHGYVTPDTDVTPEDILHFFDWDGIYTQVPDSFYGTGGGTLPVYGYFNTFPGTIICSEAYMNAVLMESTFTQTLNSNGKVGTILEAFTGIDTGTENDTLFYDINDDLIKTTHHKASNFSNEYQKLTFTYNSGNISEIHYFDDPNVNSSVQIDLVFYNSSGFVSEIQVPGNNYFEYLYNSNNLLQYVLYYNNNILIDTVGFYFYDVNNLPEYSIDKEYDFSNQSIEEIVKSEYLHDSFGRFIYENDFEFDNNSWVLDSELHYVYYSNPSGIDEIYTKKHLLSIKDILGRETKGSKNEPLFYIYDDGAVEKKIVIE